MLQMYPLGNVANLAWTEDGPQEHLLFSGVSKVPPGRFEATSPSHPSGSGTLSRWGAGPAAGALGLWGTGPLAQPPPSLARRAAGPLGRWPGLGPLGAGPAAAALGRWGAGPLAQPRPCPGAPGRWSANALGWPGAAGPTWASQCTDGRAALVRWVGTAAQG